MTQQTYEDGDTVTYKYDNSGALATLTDSATGRTVSYYYATNLQGDVTAILNSSGTAVVSYTYDAWGNPLTTTGDLASPLGIHNPLRYRGYVYDTETGLYYLQSRYYNPEISRFSGPDIVYDTDAGLQGYDLFVYCGNNPVNRIDISGADSAKIDDADIADDEASERGGGGDTTVSLTRISSLRSEIRENIQNYTYSDNSAKHKNQRPYYNSTLLKQQIIEHGHRTSEGNDVYTFRIEGSSFNASHQFFHQGIWELTVITSSSLIGHFLLRY